MQREASLQLFLNALEPALLQRTTPGSSEAQLTNRIFAQLRKPQRQVSTPAQAPLPAQQYLAEALTFGRRNASDLAAVTDAFSALEPQLTWRRREIKGPGAEDFARGHANAYIVGPGGVEERSDVWIGASLMAPHVQYVDHHHPPAEVYLVLTPGSWRQDQAPWWEPGIGGIVYNQPDVVHAMKSGTTPLFAVWCLLVDESEAV